MQWQRTSVSLLLAACLFCAEACAAENSAGQITWHTDHQPLSSALAGLISLSESANGRMTDAAPSLAYEVATSPTGTAPVTLSLRHAGPATVRQALAHAAGLWWIDTADGLLLTSTRRLPLSALSARTLSSAMLVDSHADLQAEELVTRLLEPWRTTGEILHDRATGAWSATLDDAGHARLVELLSLLQSPRPWAPALLPDAPATDPAGLVSGAQLHPGSWSAWCDELALAAELSVSLEPGLDRGATAPAVALSGTRAELPRALAAVGLRAALIRGVLCVGRNVPTDSQHPALRRRLAVIPLPHLITDNPAGQRLADTLRQRILPSAWDQPGWGLAWLPTTATRQGFLLAAADPLTIHALLDALTLLDRVGLDDGLTRLAP